MLSHIVRVALNLKLAYGLDHGWDGAPERLICTEHFSLLYAVRKKITVATTTSGIATSIMSGGRTGHSRFKIPLTIDNGAFCTFTK
jgi:hypothetical protein